jgi:hypothetical protein
MPGDEPIRPASGKLSANLPKNVHCTATGSLGRQPLTTGCPINRRAKHRTGPSSASDASKDRVPAPARDHSSERLRRVAHNSASITSGTTAKPF